MVDTDGSSGSKLHMFVSQCRALMNQLPDAVPAFELVVAAAPEEDAESVEDIEMVIDVRVEDETGEVTIHTEADEDATPGVATATPASALIAAIQRSASDSAQIFWVSGLRLLPQGPNGGEYGFRLAIPIVGFAVNEEDRVLVVLRSAKPDDLDALDRWRNRT